MYCSVEQVRGVVITDLSDKQILDIIEEVDGVIDWRYDLTGVPDLVKQRASRLKSAYTIMLRDPNAQKIGQYSEDRSKQLVLMKAEAEEALGDLDAGGSIEAFNDPIY